MTRRHNHPLQLYYVSSGTKVVQPHLSSLAVLEGHFALSDVVNDGLSTASDVLLDKRGVQSLDALRQGTGRRSVCAERRLRAKVSSVPSL